MIFISSDDQIAYYHAPKNGSRTLLGYLALTKDEKLYEEHPEYFKEVHDEVYEELRKRSTKFGLHDYEPKGVPSVENKIRVVVKRDPVKRFVSGYTNRVLFHGKLGGMKPDFTEFVSNFKYFNTKYPDVSTHFKPQVRFFGLDKDKYTHIFDTSEMHLVKELFEDTYKRKFPDLHLQQGGTNKKPQVTKEQEAWIQEMYKADYNAGWY
jgi:hypothetical protein